MGSGVFGSWFGTVDDGELLFRSDDYIADTLVSGNGRRKVVRLLS